MRMNDRLMELDAYLRKHYRELIEVSEVKEGFYFTIKPGKDDPTLVFKLKREE